MHETLDPTKEDGFNRAKVVYDRYAALCNKNAGLFHDRVNANLNRPLPVRDLLKEIQSAKRRRDVVGTNAHLAAVAKNIADFCEQEVTGREPTVRPTEFSVERDTEYLASIYGGAGHGIAPGCAGGGRNPSADEGEGKRPRECGGDTACRKEKQPRAFYDLATLNSAEWDALGLPVSDFPTPPHTVPTVPVAAAAAAAAAPPANGVVTVAGIPVQDSDGSDSSDVEL